MLKLVNFKDVRSMRMWKYENIKKVTWEILFLRDQRIINYQLLTINYSGPVVQRIE